MLPTRPISFLQLDTLWMTTAVFVAVIAWIALRTLDRPPTDSRRLRSTIAIGLQSLGCAAAAIGFTKPVLPWWAPFSLASTVLVILLGGSAIALFVSAVAVLGRNWSLVARSRADHQLVRTGPFSIVRHPI